MTPVGDHVMRLDDDDGVGATVATLGSAAVRCTGTGDVAAVGGCTGTGTAAGIGATLGSAAGRRDGAGLVVCDGETGGEGNGGCCAWSRKIVSTCVS
jgi:hypothetical protein